MAHARSLGSNFGTRSAKLDAQSTVARNFRISSFWILNNTGQVVLKDLKLRLQLVAVSRSMLVWPPSHYDPDLAFVHHRTTMLVSRKSPVMIQIQTMEAQQRVQRNLYRGQVHAHHAVRNTYQSLTLPLVERIISKVSDSPILLRHPVLPLKPCHHDR